MRSRGASKKLHLVTLGAALAVCTAAQAETPWHGDRTSGEQFGLTVGGSAATAQDTMWGQGYGFEGAVSCADAGVGCQPGDQVLAFQPIALGKHGNIYLKITNGRVSQITWAMSPVAYSDG